jgi:transposase
MDSARVHRLSASEIGALTRLYETTNSDDVRYRCQIIGLYHWGCSVPQIASIVGHGEDAIRHWVRRYEAGGVRALAATPGETPEHSC